MKAKSKAKKSKKIARPTKRPSAVDDGKHNTKADAMVDEAERDLKTAHHVNTPLPLAVRLYRQVQRVLSMVNTASEALKLRVQSLIAEARSHELAMRGAR